MSVMEAELNSVVTLLFLSSPIWIQVKSKKDKVKS
jgi:hypothetical protein